MIALISARMPFSDLLTTVWFFESSGSGIPNSFLDSLRNFVIYSSEYDFAMGAHHWPTRLPRFVPVLTILLILSWAHPKDGEGENSIVKVFNCLVGSSGSSTLVAVGAGCVHRMEGFGSSGIGMGSLSLWSSPFFFVSFIFWLFLPFGSSCRSLCFSCHPSFGSCCPAVVSCFPSLFLFFSRVSVFSSSCRLTLFFGSFFCSSCRSSSSCFLLGSCCRPFVFSYLGASVVWLCIVGFSSCSFLSFVGYHPPTFMLLSLAPLFR